MTDLSATGPSRHYTRLWRAGAARFGTVLLSWIERARQRDALSQLDERLLRDIGVSPAEAAAETKKPFWLD